MRANPSGVWQPKGRGFNMAAVQPSGHVVHFTGQVAWDELEQIVGAGLGHPEFLVELTPIAVIPDSRFVAP